MANNFKRKGNFKPVKPKAVKEAYNPADDVANYTQKFNAIGIDPKRATDDRNFIEKAFNLQQDQGFFKDAFEIIDRPRNAVSNAITDYGDGGGLGNLWEGLSGQKQSSGKDVVSKLTGKHVSDVGFLEGFLAEMVTDPLNLLVPVGANQAGKKVALQSVDDLLIKGAGKGLKKAGSKVATKLPKELVESGVKFGDEIGRALNSAKGVPKNIYNKIKEMAGTKSFAQNEMYSMVEELADYAKKNNLDLDQIARLAVKDQKSVFTGQELLDKMKKVGKKTGRNQFLLEGAPTKEISDWVDAINELPSLLPKENPLIELPEELLSMGDKKLITISKVKKKGATGYFINIKDPEMLEFVLEQGKNINPASIADDALNAHWGQRDLFENAMLDAELDDLGIANKMRDWDIENPMPRTFKPVDELLGSELSVPRQEIDFPVTPALQEAVDRYAKIASRNRQFAVDAGLNIGDRAGYMHKSLSEEALKDDTFKLASGIKGNPKAFSESIYEMSPQAVNQALGTKMFKENVFDILDSSISKTTNQTERLAVFKEAISNPDGVVIRSMKSSDPNFNYDKLKSEGYEIFRGGSNVAKEFKSKFNFLSETSDLDGVLKLGKGENLVIDKRVYDLLSFDKSKSAELGTLFKAHDKFMGYWKGSKLMSAGYYMRNYSGNTVNMFLAGMPVQDVFTYQAKGARDYARFTGEIVEQVAKAGTPDILGKADRALYEEIAEFARSGLISDTKVKNEMREVLTEIVKKTKDPNILQKVMKKNFEYNQFIDDFNRFATWRWAKENFEKVGLKSADEASDFVRYCLFDYQDLSKIENEYLRRIFPFYTFAKKNVAFHAKNILKQPNRYKNLNRAVTNYQESFGLDDETLPDYAEEGMWLPIYKKDGKVEMLKVNMPQGEAFQAFQDPINVLVNSTSPLIKMAFELQANKRFFTGEDIQKFEGQEITDNRFVKDPYQDYIGEELFGGITGKGKYALDVLEQLMQKPIGRDKMPSNFKVAPSLTSTVNPEVSKLGNIYDELNRLKDLEKAYKQNNNGMSLPTMTEIRKATEKPKSNFGKKFGSW